MSGWKFCGLTGVWCGCVVAGFGRCCMYASIPADRMAASGVAGFIGIAPRCRSADVVDVRSSSLSLFRASLSELNVLATQCRDRFALQIVFVRPEGLPPGSEDSSLLSDSGRNLRRYGKSR